MYTGMILCFSRISFIFSELIGFNNDSSSFFRSKLCYVYKKDITVANSFSSVISRLFSFSIDLLEFKPLLLKNGFIVSQNFLLFHKSFTFSFWKYSVLGRSLLIPCSSSGWGLICQCIVRWLLIINYFLVQKVELKIYYYRLLKFCFGLPKSLWHNHRVKRA